MKKSITWLKGMAMLLIVISHMYTVSGNKVIYEFCDDLGRLGVIFFICISAVAYGNSPQKVYKINNGKDILTYICKKIKPLYKIYVIFLIIMFFIRMMFKENIKYLVLQLVVSIPLLQSYIPYKTVFAYSLNTPMWYLSMMLLLWGGLPFTKKVCEALTSKKFNWNVIYVTLIVFIYGLCQLNIGDEWKRWLIYVNPVINWIYFSFAYLYANTHTKYCSKRLIGGCITLLVTYAVKDFFPVDFRVVIFILPVVMITQNLFVYSKVSQFNGFFLYLGKTSTTLFITHYPICYIFRSLGYSGPIPFIICLAMIIGLSHIVYRMKF